MQSFPHALCHVHAFFVDGYTIIHSHDVRHLGKRTSIEASSQPQLNGSYEVGRCCIYNLTGGPHCAAVDGTRAAAVSIRNRSLGAWADVSHPLRGDRPFLWHLLNRDFHVSFLDADRSSHCYCTFLVQCLSTRCIIHLPAVKDFQVRAIILQ